MAVEIFLFFLLLFFSFTFYPQLPIILRLFNSFPSNSIFGFTMRFVATATKHSNDIAHHSFILHFQITEIR